jgi:hypothetical protein
LAIEKTDDRHRRLLRPRPERPRRRAPDSQDELAPPHSRTSLARATNTSDKETPSDAAVLRLTAMQKRGDCSIGMSVVFLAQDFRNSCRNLSIPQ